MQHDIIPQWLIDQRAAMDRRLFDQNIELANRHRWLALNGPEDERAGHARMAEHYVTMAMAFSTGEAS